MTALAATYVLPLRASRVVEDLDSYLEGLASHLEVIVVDGSSSEVFDAHHQRWAQWVRHMAVDPDLVTPMGKVGGVLTGVRHARQPAVILADDDVRWSRDLLVDGLGRLPGAAVVRPQNMFRPAPWPARWDTGRILLNRALGGDWPGTLIVDRDALIRAGGYDGSVMFENLELVRTLRAAGGVERLALDLFVPRRPPSRSEFIDQRVRQAYDEMARPWRLAAQLALLPAVLIGGRRTMVALAATTVVTAEVGRRRAHGVTVFAPTAALWALAWVAERAVTSWLALWARVRHGGIRYRGVVLATAAHSSADLRGRLRAPGPMEAGPGPER